MPFCRECGKEVEDDWASCPFCSQPIQVSDSNSEQDSKSQNGVTGEVVVVNQTDNTMLWNVCVIAITLAIVFWPHGPFGLNLLDYASADCEWSDDFLEDDLGLTFDEYEDDCNHQKTQVLIFLFVILFIAVVVLLLINNRSLLVEDIETASEKGITSWSQMVFTIVWMIGCLFLLILSEGDVGNLTGYCVVHLLILIAGTSYFSNSRWLEEMKRKK